MCTLVSRELMAKHKFILNLHELGKPCRSVKGTQFRGIIMVLGLNESEVIDPIYLPFKPAELRPHLLVDTEGQLKHYKDSAKRYREFCMNSENRKRIPISKARFPCQIEKDERFWTATTLKHLYDSPDRTEAFSKILTQEFGPLPPISGFKDWKACLDGPLSS
jgi:hypothetical protein